MQKYNDLMKYSWEETKMTGWVETYVFIFCVSALLFILFELICTLILKNSFCDICILFHEINIILE